MRYKNSPQSKSWLFQETRTSPTLAHSSLEQLSLLKLIVRSAWYYQCLMIRSILFDSKNLRYGAYQHVFLWLVLLLMPCFISWILGLTRILMSYNRSLGFKNHFNVSYLLMLSLKVLLILKARCILFFEVLRIFRLSWENCLSYYGILVPSCSCLLISLNLSLVYPLNLRHRKYPN